MRRNRNLKTPLRDAHSHENRQHAEDGPASARPLEEKPGRDLLHPLNLGYFREPFLLDPCCRRVEDRFVSKQAPLEAEHPVTRWVELGSGVEVSNPPE